MDRCFYRVYKHTFIGTSFKIPSIIEMYAHCALGFGVRGLAWKIYDEQLRLKMRMDSTTCWDAVDQKLWLLYMVGGYNNELHSSSAVFNNYRPSVNKCCNFNFTGICERNPCNYKQLQACLFYMFREPPGLFVHSWYWTGKFSNSIVAPTNTKCTKLWIPT